MANKQKSVNSKPKQTAASVMAAHRYAKKLAKQEFGPCTITRAVTQKYKSLSRADVLSIASELDINQHTASRQYQEVRSGKTRVVGV